MPSDYDFGRVAVLMGGTSAEREISLQSGAAVLAGLRRSGVDAHPLDMGKNFLTEFKSDEFDRVFIIVHGRGGEDGQVQGVLDLMEMPYTGSGVLGSALGMDKLRCKYVWQGMQLSTPPFLVLTRNSDPGQVVAELGLPLMVKPAREGSSIGVTKIDKKSDLVSAWEHAAGFDDCVLAERWIVGDEYSVPVLGDRTLPMIRLETPREFYDYQAKYHADSTRYICPCGLSDSDELAVRELAFQAFASIGGSGWGRVDLLIDVGGKPWLIEVNTVPGMTSHSLVPMSAEVAGIDFDELVVRILATSMEVGVRR
jgi:D-alanine-D-alanine ligase